MATSFPGTAIDSFNAIGTANFQDESGYEHLDFHNDANDAVVAVQTKVGKDGDTGTATHDYKLSNIQGTQKAVSNYNGTLNGTLFGAPTIASTPNFEGTPIFDEDIWLTANKNILVRTGTADGSNPYRTISVGALRPTTTSGFGTVTTVQFTGAGTVDLDVAPFTPSTPVSGFRNFTMPKSWDGLSVNTHVKWCGAGTAGASSAVFGAKIVEIKTDGTIANAHGTEGTISDAYIGTSVLQTTGAIAVTPGGESGANGEMQLVITRKTSDAQDTYTGTAYVTGAYIEYGIKTYSDN